jgi:hypothetical protein
MILVRPRRVFCTMIAPVIAMIDQDLSGQHRNLLEVDGYASQSEDCYCWCSHPAWGSLVLLLRGFLPHRECGSGKSCFTSRFRLAIRSGKSCFTCGLRLGIPAVGADAFPRFFFLCCVLLFREQATPQVRCHLISPKLTMVTMVVDDLSQQHRSAIVVAGPLMVEQLPVNSAAARQVHKAPRTLVFNPLSQRKGHPSTRQAKDALS